MAFDSTQLHRHLAKLGRHGTASRYVVAFSGGLDSTVLLHALAVSQGTDAMPILAVHIDHGLQAGSGDWATHCQQFAESLQVEFVSIEVEVDRNSGQGLESAARGVRYGALQKLLQPDDWLLTAHHEDDQAETLLLNVLRGSGVAGIAGIGEKQPMGAGWLVRPLLNTPQKDLRSYAEDCNLAWLEDPSNTDNRFDRNFLRNEILPRFAERWPAGPARLARSAALAGEASTVLEQLADSDLEAVGQPARLEIQALLALSDERQRNLLRRALKLGGLSGAPEASLRRILDELIPARADAEPLVRWSGGEARRYRNGIYLLPEMSDVPAVANGLIGAGQPCLDLGTLGTLTISGNAPQKIQADVLSAGLSLRFRTGGETIRPAGRRRTHKLKKLLQEKGVVPWMRERIPLLYCEDQLVAVADLWVAEPYADERGAGIEWRSSTAIF